MKQVPYRMKEPFECMVYDTEPQKVTNPYSGDSTMLTTEEIAVYDTIKGAELAGLYDTVRKGVDWFVQYNINAYSVLLD